MFPIFFLRVCYKIPWRQRAVFERKEGCASSSQAQSTFDINYAFGLHKVRCQVFLYHHRLRIYTHQQRDSKLEKKTSIVRFVVLPTRCDSSSLANRLKLLFFITASRQNKQKEKKTGFRQRSSFCHHRLSVAKEVGVRESRGGNGRCLLARARSENAILKKQKIRAQSEIEKLSLSFHHLVETK